MKVIFKITWNWQPSIADSKDTYPEKYMSAELCKGGVSEIREHGAQGAGDRWFYDIICDNGDMTRVFNPNEVFYREE